MENNSKVRDEILPECWKDEVRMNSLFAPFRKRSVNPLDWDSKLKFWKTLIDKWCSCTNRPVFTLAEVTTFFERNGRRALCLPDVVSEMIRSGDACKLADFERGAVSGAVLPGEEVGNAPSSSWAGWAVDVMVKRPLSWAASRLWSGGEGGAFVEVAPEEPIIIFSVLKNVSDKIVESSTGELVDISELQKSEYSKESFRLALLLLQRRGLATTTTHGHTTLVKVASEHKKCASSPTSVSSSVTTSPLISEVERSSYVLQKDETALQKNIEQLEEEKAKLTEEAREYIRKGMRQLAKSSLRKKHALEQCIEKRVQALENVQALLHRVKEAETDGQVLESYKLGVSALKKTLAEAGLTEDNVENTRAELEEVLDLQGDITNTLSDMGKLAEGDFEEAELEDELAELLAHSESTPEKVPSTEILKKKEGENKKWGENIEQRLKNLTVEDLPSPPDDLLGSPSDKVKPRILAAE